MPRFRWEQELAQFDQVSYAGRSGTVALVVASFTQVDDGECEWLVVIVMG